MRVLVCGGREYDDEATMRLYLRFLRSCDTVIHGAARGADRLAGIVAKSYGCTDLDQVSPAELAVIWHVKP